MLWFQLDEAWSLVGPTWSSIDNPITDPGGEIFVRMSGTGRFMGHRSNIVNYSYNEGSTPLLPGDESGAIGDISIEVMDCTNASILLYRDQFFLEDRFHGSVQGSIENVSGSNSNITMGGRSILSLLNVEEIIPPRRDTIGNILEAVCNDVGLLSNIFQDPALPTGIVNAPAHEGDVWVYVKQLCAAHEVEVSVVEDYVVIRPSRQRVVDATNIVEKNWQVQDITLARNFDVAYYNYEQVEDFLVYPKGGWTEDVQVYQVGAGETTTFDIPVDFYLTSVNQPTVQASVAKDYAGPASVYAVSGNDGLPITPAQWTAQGGDMSFKILGDGSVIEVTITGPNFPELAPFTIGLNDGSSSYSTLRITGDGMNFNKQVYTEKTGLKPSDTPIENAGEIDNPGIDTLEDAKRFALFARRLYSLPTQTFSTSADQFRRLRGSTPTIFFPTFDEFDGRLPAAYSFSNFNDDYSGITFDQFTTQLGNTVPQGFGELVGSKVKLEDAMYRIRNVNITPQSVSIDTEYDTLFSDLVAVFRAPQWADMEAAWGGLNDTWDEAVEFDEVQFNFDDFNDAFRGTTFRDYALIPLRTEGCFPT